MALTVFTLLWNGCKEILYISFIAQVNLVTKSLSNVGLRKYFICKLSDWRRSLSDHKPKFEVCLQIFITTLKLFISFHPGHQNVSYNSGDWAGPIYFWLGWLRDVGQQLNFIITFVSHIISSSVCYFKNKTRSLQMQLQSLRLPWLCNFLDSNPML